MLISLKDKKDKLIYKDMLDIDYDMSVKEQDNKYYIAINRYYRYAELFMNESDAVEKMSEIASLRNQLEVELKNY